MAKEAFLVNPAKKRKRKGRGPYGKVSKAKRKRHRPVLYGPPGGPWSRSRHSRSRSRGVSINPYLMTAGANPPRRRRSYKRRATPKRRYRRNPPARGLTGAFTLRKFQSNLPFFLTGGVSAITTTMAPGFAERMLPAVQFPNLIKYGSQIGTALGGAFLVDTMVPRRGHGMVWMIVSGATIAADLLREFVMPAVGLPVSDYEVNDYEVNDYEMEGEDEIGHSENDYDDVGAFPDQFSDELEAFPDTDSYGSY